MAAGAENYEEVGGIVRVAATAGARGFGPSRREDCQEAGEEEGGCCEEDENVEESGFGHVCSVRVAVMTGFVIIVWPWLVVMREEYGYLHVRDASALVCGLNSG